MPVLPPVIPLFPLPNVVLFPKMPLPLHVFEPRYRKMVSDILEDHRGIGMVLLRSGWEADYYGRPAVYPLGCMGFVDSCQGLADGRYNLVLRGVARFRIREERGGDLYRLAAVDYRGDEMGDPAALESCRSRVLKALARTKDGPSLLVAREELPHEVFVNAASQALDLSPVEKQSLLDCDSILARYQRLLELLEFRQLERTFGRAGEGSVH